MSVASSEIFSLMLSLRLRSTALWDSRLRRRFSLAINALPGFPPYVIVIAREARLWLRVQKESGRAKKMEMKIEMKMEQAIWMSGRISRFTATGANALFRSQVIWRRLALLHAHHAHAGDVDFLRTHAEAHASETCPAIERSEA